METYRQVFILGLKKSYQYRANFYLGLIGVLFPLTIQFFLWTGMYKSSSENTIFGYELYQILSYSVFACLVNTIISTSFVYAINDDIKNGGLAKYLVKPMSYFKYNFFGFIGEKIATIIIASVILILAWVGIVIASKQIFDVTSFALFFVALFLAIILNFMIFYCVSSLGFWMQDASGAVFIATLIGTIVSGGIFPLDIFSHNIQFLLKLLPFAYTNYFSVSVLCQTISGRKVVTGLLMQLLWIAVCYFLSKVIWKIGTKKYVSIGG